MDCKYLTCSPRQASFQPETPLEVHLQGQALRCLSKSQLLIGYQLVLVGVQRCILTIWTWISVKMADEHMPPAPESWPGLGMCPKHCVPKKTPASMPCLLHAKASGPRLHAALIHSEPRVTLYLLQTHWGARSPELGNASFNSGLRPGKAGP